MSDISNPRDERDIAAIRAAAKAAAEAYAARAAETAAMIANFFALVATPGKEPENDNSNHTDSQR